MPRGGALRRVYARSHASATPQVSDKVTDLVTGRLGIVEPLSGAVAETRVHEPCRLLDHRFDRLHRRYTGPAQPRGLQDTGPLLKLGGRDRAERRR